MSETIPVVALTRYPRKVDVPLWAVRREGDGDDCLSLNRPFRHWPS